MPYKKYVRGIGRRRKKYYVRKDKHEEDKRQEKHDIQNIPLPLTPSRKAFRPNSNTVSSPHNQTPVKSCAQQDDVTLEDLNCNSEEMDGVIALLSLHTAQQSQGNPCTNITLSSLQSDHSADLLDGLDGLLSLSHQPVKACYPSFHPPSKLCHQPSMSASSYPPLPSAIGFDMIQSAIEKCTLPSGWVSSTSMSEINFVNFQRQLNDAQNLKILKEVVLRRSGDWEVRVLQRRITNGQLLLQFPKQIVMPSTLLELIGVVDSCATCIGNPDTKFHEISEARGGIFTGTGKASSVTGTCEEFVSQDNSGQIHTKTLRATDCEILLESTSTDERCTQCKDFRRKLSAILSKKRKATSEDRIKASSKVPLSTLKPDELMARTHNIIKAKRQAEARLGRLKTRLRESIEKDGESLDVESADGLTRVLNEYDEVIQKEYEDGSFQRLFWEQQKSALKCTDKRGHRWHPMFIKWCLNLRLRSGAAYRTLRDSGVLELPNERTLRDYTQWANSSTGLTAASLEQLCRECKIDDLEDHQKYVVLLHDELRIRSDLVYVKESGTLVGFVDFGNFNNSLVQYQRSLEHESPSSSTEASQRKPIARYILAFMIRGVTLRLQYPVSHYATNTITGDLLFSLVWETIEWLELIGLKVIASTSDGASPNRRFYRLHREEGVPQGEVVFSTVNPCQRDGRKIYFFSDVPHLVKTVRNCFSNSGAHSHKRMLWNGEAISWQTIIDLYKADLDRRGGLFLCHKLKHDHVYLKSFSRMKVSYAAQVLSSRVANAIEQRYGNNKGATVDFIRRFDRFFDCLNVRSMTEGHRKLKPDLLPYNNPNDPRLEWLQDDLLGYLRDWDERVDRRQHLSKKEKGRMKLSRETLEGIRMSVNAFVEVTRYLLRQPGVQCILSEKFNQDPLESYFGNQRQMRGGNEAPTVLQFGKNANALRLKASNTLHIRGANVRTFAEMPIDDTPLPRRL